MDTFDIRRENLRRLIEKLGGAVQLAEEIGKSPSFVSHLKTGHRSIGEKVARQIEQKLNQPLYSLDRDSTSCSSREDLEVLIQTMDDVKLGELLNYARFLSSQK
jgi:transcriptional regulator with XRE-family HTH domain